jgi:hypothetical protein
LHSETPVFVEQLYIDGFLIQKLLFLPDKVVGSLHKRPFFAGASFV